MSEPPSSNTFAPKLRLAYLYSDLLNIYGDRGNVLCLQQRCKWRGIDLEIEEITTNQNSAVLSNFDLFFIGGGQDSQQVLVAKDLLARRSELSEAIEAGAVMLAICGGYQILGEYYRSPDGTQLEGLGILNVYTEAPGYLGDKLAKIGDQNRLVGNVVAELSLDLEPKTLVGFENHSGRTFIREGGQTRALAHVLKGHGNNAIDSTEGAIYKNLFASYLHGSLLPKNPHLADELLLRALRNKVPDYELTTLNNEIELAAHQEMCK